VKLKILLITAVVCLTCEILFSFYYSSTSLSLNERYNSIQIQLTQLKITQEQLEIKLAELSSLKNIQTFITNNQWTPIKNHYAF
jgi:hypothetical protein